MLELIIRKDRMQEVIDLSRRLAAHYELDAEHVTTVFEFMMQLTIDVEIHYIRNRMAVQQ